MRDMLMMGEVVAAFPPTHTENFNKLRWEYAVKCIQEDGTPSIFHRAIKTEFFSSPLDYSQQVLQSSNEDQSKAYVSNINNEGAQLTLGSRCIVGFLNGNEYSPIILGLLPHPLSPVIVDMPENRPDMDTQLEDGKVYPKIAIRFNGMDFTVNETGELHITHFGKGNLTQEEPFKDIEYEAPDETETTRMSFKDKGVFQIQDSFGQIIEIDPVNKLINISNGENTISMDKDGKALGISSTGKVTEVAGEERVRYTGKSEKITIKGNQESTIAGDVKNTIKGKVENKIDGDVTNTIKGDEKTTVNGDSKITIKGDGSWTVNGKVTIKASGELVISGNNIKIDGTGAGGSGATGSVLAYPAALSDFTGKPIIPYSQTVKVSP